MSRDAPELTEEERAKIEPLIPKRKPSKMAGSKLIEDHRCFEGCRGSFAAVYAVAGRSFRAVPSAATCWRLQEWENAAVWLDLWRKWCGERDVKGILSWDEMCSDGTFSPAKRGADDGTTQFAKDIKLMVVADGRG